MWLGISIVLLLYSFLHAIVAYILFKNTQRFFLGFRIFFSFTTPFIFVLLMILNIHLTHIFLPYFLSNRGPEPSFNVVALTLGTLPISAVGTYLWFKAVEYLNSVIKTK